MVDRVLTQLQALRHGTACWARCQLWRWFGQRQFGSLGLIVFVSLMTTTSPNFADEQRLPSVGILWNADAAQAAPYLESFKRGLRERGWVDRRNVRIVERFDNGDSSRFPGLATELVGLRVDVLFTTDVAMSAARQATTTIPIVCADFVDPVTEGVTRSMARPDSNVTGVSWQSAETAAKRLQLARELIPTLRRVALIYDASDPGIVLEAKGVSDTARIAKLHLKKFEVRSASDFKQAFAKTKHARPDVLLVSTNPLTWEQFPKIADFGARNRLPVISELPEFAERGAVLTYGVDIFEAYLRGAYFVDKILRGAKPSELPFEQAAKFDLVVNLKTAKALRISVPQSITNIATRVIQ